MYSTCLYCHQQLGKNEALEHFQVGRRLAYDAAVGRLWVICGKCQRWNLSPIETRWEAVEEAERAFRGTRLRVSTDNIALAQLREGLELVRIGKPPQLELAGWRYGNLFARRWQKHMVIAGGSMAVSGAYFAATLGQFVFPSLAQLSTIGSMSFVGYTMFSIVQMQRDKRRIRFRVRDKDGEIFAVTRENARAATLLPATDNEGWMLQLEHRDTDDDVYETRSLRTVMQGEYAMRAVATLLPFLNRTGARETQVREALDVIDSKSSVGELFRSASRTPVWKHGGFDLMTSRAYLGELPPRLRLALEMVLHEESERRALEGELAELYERWKDAEEIGKIADGLT